MTVKELERVVNAHLIESADVNRKFTDGIASLNSKMNWILTLISACVVALLTAVLRG